MLEETQWQGPEVVEDSWEECHKYESEEEDGSRMGSLGRVSVVIIWWHIDNIPRLYELMITFSMLDVIRGAAALGGLRLPTCGGGRI